MSKTTSLILKIDGTNPDIQLILTKDNKTQNVTLGDNTYEVSIRQLGFSKKMYCPGEITADMKLSMIKGTTWQAAQKSQLEALFLYKKVTLLYGDLSHEADGKWTISNEQNVCEGYFVYTLEPRYQVDRMFVTLKIYSPDKLMTLEETCRSWVAKRLGRDIIEEMKSRFMLPYEQTSTLNYDYQNMQQLAAPPEKKYGEAFFPYLVQYNESFWDFLVRTANRWGEFLYYEGETLYVGFNSAAQAKAIDSYASVTWCNPDGDDRKRREYGSRSLSAVYDDDMLNRELTKGEYDKVMAEFTCGPDDGLDKWITKTVGNLLSSGKNLYDFTVDTIVDDTISLMKAKKKTGEKNDEFDSTYFAETDTKDDVKGAHYGSNGSKFNQFAAIEPIITKDLYKKVLVREFESATKMICIDFDTHYTHLLLGDIITVKNMVGKYVVTAISSSDKETLTVDNGQIKSIHTTIYQAIAIQQDSEDRFYPTMHPAGHIRTSGPQLATVAADSKNDPARQHRVRVRFPWQSDDSDPTPWIFFARPGGNKNTGSYNRHYEKESVIVEFAEGNVERPYVAGALNMNEQDVPMVTQTNDIVHITPGGQSIKMTDGVGSGITAMIAGMQPGLKMVHGFMPSLNLFPDFDNNACFEGNIEISDMYGFYSIKGCTNDRNITIKSPFGDVKLSAFTGITVSAPNGDVKIQGKNVTIEAGNNLTLISGKNIKEKFYTTEFGAPNGTNFMLAATAAVTKKLASIVGGFIDLSIVRSVVEVFVRPVEGKLTVKSNRYLALEAGKGKTAYPVDAYQRRINGKISNIYKEKISRSRTENLQRACQSILSAFAMSHQIAKEYVLNFSNNYKNGQNAVAGLKKNYNNYTTLDELPCNSLKDILDALWSNPDSNIDGVIGFKGVFAKQADQLTDEDIKFFVNSFKGTSVVKARKKVIKFCQKKQETYKREIKERVTAIANAIKLLKQDKLKNRVEGNQMLEDDAKNAVKNIVPPESFTIKTTPRFKQFADPMSKNVTDDGIKQLSRKMYVALVDAYKIPREKVGAVKGVGGQVPPAPDPYADNIEDDWNKYVESIQQMVKENKVWGDTLLSSVVDTIGQGVTGIIDDMRDIYAFGSNRKGQILFSDGGPTKILNKDMEKANVRDVDDPDRSVASISKAVAEEIRHLMKA